MLRGEELLEVHFEKLVIGTGSHVRLPPIAGNDLPGVVGIEGGAVRPGRRTGPRHADRGLGGR